MTKFAKILGTVATIATISALPAAAAVYNVNLDIASGSVTGTVETDGTTGTLSSGNFIDWNLDLSDGTTSFTLIGNGSPGDNSGVKVLGTSVSATATELTFDFTQSTGYILFQTPNPGSGQTWFCIENDGCTLEPEDTFTVNPTSSSSGVIASNPQSGVVTWATVEVAPVPLPAGGWLLLSAVGAAAGLRRRAKRKA